MRLIRKRREESFQDLFLTVVVDEKKKRKDERKRKRRSKKSIIQSRRTEPMENSWHCYYSKDRSGKWLRSFLRDFVVCNIKWPVIRLVRLAKLLFEDLHRVNPLPLSRPRSQGHRMSLLGIRRTRGRCWSFARPVEIIITRMYSVCLVDRANSPSVYRCYALLRVSNMASSNYELGNVLTWHVDFLFAKLYFL